MKKFSQFVEARAKKAVAGGKVQKLITGFGMTYKGKKYDEIDFELDNIDNSSQIVTLKILHPREHIGDKVKVSFKSLRVGRFMATDTSKINEATYQGKKVPLNKPMAGDVKKSKVYVDPDGDGKAKKVNFGDKNMKIKKNIPSRRKSFRARHNCDNPGPKDKARYWSCKAW